MIGKKGITKLVLRSILPILNSEVQRLLDDICDFEVEIFMDDKNDVRYLLVKDGVEKPLKSASGLERTISSLAIRVVLGKMSALPMPNFITFDEILGRVASENVMKLEPLFDKIKDISESQSRQRMKQPKPMLCLCAASKAVPARSAAALSKL